MFRFLMPLLFMFGPQFAPRIIKFVRAVWRLHKDHRVNIVLKLLIPLALVYAVFPVDLIRDRIPFGLGRYDDYHFSGCQFSYSEAVPRAVCGSHGEHRRHVPRISDWTRGDGQADERTV